MQRDSGGLSSLFVAAIFSAPVAAYVMFKGILDSIILLYDRLLHKRCLHGTLAIAHDDPFSVSN
jgi:hypothetical protein